MEKMIMSIIFLSSFNTFAYSDGVYFSKKDPKIKVKIDGDIVEGYTTRGFRFSGDKCYLYSVSRIVDFRGNQLQLEHVISRLVNSSSNTSGCVQRIEEVNNRSYFNPENGHTYRYKGSSLDLSGYSKTNEPFNGLHILY